MDLHLTEFIRARGDWREILAEPPYGIRVKDLDPFVLLKYNQYASDFTLPVVRECRGVILDAGDRFRPVCVPFFKFGNFGEPYVPDIDWNSAVVQEKVDGSLIKLWNYKGTWRVSSNGEIDARNAKLTNVFIKYGTECNLFDLFTEAWNKTGVSFSSLDPGFTYMFELISPVNRVVVKYPETEIVHIGTRDNRTFEETDRDIGVRKPRFFPLHSLEECIRSAKELPCSEEGYVVVDKDYNRVKVKSPMYVALNNMAQGVISYERVVEIIRDGEAAELLAYFPEYQDVFSEAERNIDEFARGADEQLAKIRAMQFEDRKSLAAVVTRSSCPACIFSVLDGKQPSSREWLMQRPLSKIVTDIGLGT
ncbi:MAG: hypothetical protein LBT26_09750 [Clostridiales Family XIII bacterium]|jgi:hypothetical protein|nr:hypothetical protein [Clostridiales Family XIII bacterium]